MAAATSATAVFPDRPDEAVQGEALSTTSALGERRIGGAVRSDVPRIEPTSTPDLAQWRRIAREIAKGPAAARPPNLTETIDAFLDQIEAVDKEYPIRNLRWALAHFNQPNAAQLERMKAGLVCGGTSVGGHQRRHQRAPVRRGRVRHGAARDDPEERHHLGPWQRRQPGQSDPAVRDALLGP